MLKDKIKQQYRVRLILDNLPITTYDLELDPESGGCRRGRRGKSGVLMGAPGWPRVHGWSCCIGAGPRQAGRQAGLI